MGVVIKPKDHLCEVCYWRTNLKVFEFEREEEFTSGVVKKILNMKSIICVLLLPLIVAGWGQKYEKIRLRDVQVFSGSARLTWRAPSGLGKWRLFVRDMIMPRMTTFLLVVVAWSIHWSRQGRVNSKTATVAV